MIKKLSTLMCIVLVLAGTPLSAASNRVRHTMRSSNIQEGSYYQDDVPYSGGGAVYYEQNPTGTPAQEGMIYYDPIPSNYPQEGVIYDPVTYPSETMIQDGTHYYEQDSSRCPQDGMIYYDMESYPQGNYSPCAPMPCGAGPCGPMNGGPAPSPPPPAAPPRCPPPCAPACRANCGVSICAIVFAIAAVIAAGAIVLASGDSST